MGVDAGAAVLECRLRELRVLGRPLLLGTSRKSTIGVVLGLPDACKGMTFDRVITGSAGNDTINGAGAPAWIRLTADGSFTAITRPRGAPSTRAWRSGGAPVP